MYSNHYHIVKLLLEDESSDVNGLDSDGHAPVHIAAIWGFSRVLSLILSHPDCKIDMQVWYIHYTVLCVCVCVCVCHLFAYYYRMLCIMSELIVPTPASYTCDSLN